MTDTSIKEKIVLATIACIEKEGILNVTVRKIASIAQVNVAAVNYHFSNKEKLLQIVMEKTMEEGFGQNLKDYEELWETDTLRALRLFLKDTLEGALRYPNITKAHLSEVFNKNDYNNPTVHRYNAFMTEFYNLIKNILLQKDDVSGKIAVAQLLNSILMVGMMPDLYETFWGFSLKDKENQDKFIKVIIENYCNTEEL
jgi:AcrR family transcriptional regulator